MNKKFLSILLVLTMVFSMLPMTAVATEPEIVYISVSDDSEYVMDSEGNPLAFTAVTFDELSTIELDSYGLSDYVYDADNDGTPEITALHLYIYVHEEILGLDWSDVYITGGAGSIYFAGDLFGFSDENLRYDLNGAYPAVDGWGLTADQIVLSNGDFINVAHYTSWAFWGDSATGFHYFTDTEGNLKHTYSIPEGETVEIGLVRSYSDWMNGGLPAFAEEPYYEICYGTSYGNATGSLTTDEDGFVQFTLPTAGTWYVWANGGYGMENPMDIVSAPAFAIINVEEAQPDPDVVAAQTVESKIGNIGTVTSASKTAIEEARLAYDALSDAQKLLVGNYDVLVAAESVLTGINADMENAKAVEEKINAIGSVTIHSCNKIKEARKAYDTLTDSQKNYVENLKILTDAESAIALLYAEASDIDHKSIYEATGKYINGLGTPSVGTTGGEWMVIDLTRTGYDCPQGYYKNVVDYVKKNINDKEQLHKSKSTDNSRVILALTSAGYDVTDVDGHNLLMGLTDMGYLKKQGINGPIWALIALDCHDYEIPTNKDATEQVTRQKLIAYILEKQLEDGGWALSGKIADPDMTGMAVQALAPYYETNTEVKEAVDKALSCLSDKQYDNGGFGSIDGTCSESCAQVIVALTALGINPETDSRFVKNGVSVVDAMCLFAVDGGGFAHIPDGGLNGMATEQGQYALAAYYRFLDGKTSLYDMSDVVIRENSESSSVKDTATTESPKTGDNSTPWMYMLIMILAMACYVTYLKMIKRCKIER